MSNYNNENSLNKAVSLMIVSAMLIGLPTLLGMATGIATPDVAATPGTMGDVANQMTNCFSQLTDLINGIAYIGGIGFGIKAMLAFKQHADGGTYYEKSDAVQKIKKEAIPIVKQEVKEIPVVKVPAKPLFDMEDKVLNDKVKNILDKITKIETMQALEHDIENKILLESTLNDYLPKIQHAYLAIPVEFRKKKINHKSSSYELAASQLDLISEKLDEIEKCVLNDQQKELRVVEQFLKEKMATGSFTLNNLDVEQEVEKELNS